jgi:plastocyanin
LRRERAPGRRSGLARRPFVLVAVISAAMAAPVFAAAQTVHTGIHHHKRTKHASTRPAARQAGKSTASRRAANSAAHRSGDPGVTIADFLFSPGSITIHVGDTIVWTNNGPSAHTATANNGSFDTGVLQKGKSASVTFHNPGTFDYHCSIHPFMHGAVVVLASTKTTPSSTKKTPSGTTPSTSSTSGTPSSGSNTSPSSSASPSTSSTSSSQATLPMTGVNVLALALTGLLLMGAGLMLRRLHRG